MNNKLQCNVICFFYKLSITKNEYSNIGILCCRNAAKWHLRSLQRCVGLLDHINTTVPGITRKNKINIFFTQTPYYRFARVQPVAVGFLLSRWLPKYWGYYTTRNEKGCRSRWQRLQLQFTWHYIQLLTETMKCWSTDGLKCCLHLSQFC